MNQLFLVILSFIIATITSCNMTSNKNSSGSNATISIKEETGTYTSDNITCNTFTAYDENNSKKRPAVIVVPEWWGLNDYIRSRARQLAGLGYLAMAIDVYGDGKTGNNPDEAGALASPFYKNPALTKSGIDAALDIIKKNPFADSTQIVAIGYCFGGYTVLNAAKLGANLKGVVSFHGGLGGAPANKDLLKARILVCHGEDDKFVLPDEVNTFRKGMDSIGAVYIFKSYPNATHAFTNPAATENGKKFSLPIAYNAAADTASWNDMKNFFEELFK